MLHDSDFRTLFSRCLALIVMSATSLVWLPCAAWAGGNPVVESMFPLGAQTGTKFDLTIKGYNLAGTKGILSYQPGFQVVNLKSVSDEEAVLEVKLDADAELGQHELHVVSETGLSDLLTFRLSPYSEVAEVEDNNKLETAQTVSINSTIVGTITETDVDHFAVELSKGQRLSVEVEAFRLCRELFDPLLVVIDPHGNTVKIADDSRRFGLDGYCSLIVPESGRYIIGLRESAFEGNDQSHYRLHIGDFQRPEAVFPAGGQAGEDLVVSLIGGDAQGSTCSVTLPLQADGFWQTQIENGTESPSPLRLRVSPFPNAIEPTTHPLAVPIAFNGVISQAGEQDQFQLLVQRGEEIEIAVFGQRIDSPIDPVLTIRDPAGNVLMKVDDTYVHDPVVRFQVPRTEMLTVSIEDHLKRGGETYVYRAEVTNTPPTPAISIPPIQRYTQKRQQIIVPRGNRFAAMVAVRGRQDENNLTLIADQLPAGVTLESRPFTAGDHTVPALFTVAEDAPEAIGFVNLMLSADGQTSIPSEVEQQAAIVVGPRTIYRDTVVDKFPLLITTEAPFRVDLEQPNVPIVIDGFLQLRVTAERFGNFDEPIKITLPCIPPYIEQPDEEEIEIIIQPGKTEVYYPLIATAEAEPGIHKVLVVAEAEAGLGSLCVASNWIDLHVENPHAEITIQTAEASQGQNVMLACNIKSLREFTGEATVRLRGLPNGATAPDIMISPESKELVFPISISAETPVSIHNTLYCEHVIENKGAAIMHFSGRGGTLDIRPAGSPPRDAESRLNVLRRIQREKRKTVLSESTGAGDPE